jgi:hypothetical protein
MPSHGVAVGVAGRLRRSGRYQGPAHTLTMPRWVLWPGPLQESVFLTASSGSNA